MHQEYRAFLEQPTPTTFRRARTAVLQLPAYDAQTADLFELVELFAAEKFAEARAKIEAMMPHWALSPRVHGLAAEIAHELGDQDDAELEQFVAATCLRGLLGTGDGSRAFPYLVTHSSDEQAILAALGQRACGQAFVESGGRRYDVVRCDDEAEIWFDLTDLLADRPAVFSASKRAARPAMG